MHDRTYNSLRREASYGEGTFFAIPLRTGGFARGVVARVSPKKASLLGYFFGPKLNCLGDVNVHGMSPDCALAMWMFGDLGLKNGQWPILGILPGWRREDWAMPDFVRRDPIGKRAWLVRLSDDDPSVVELEEPVEFETGLSEHSLSGYGSVELKLTRMLT
jgi:hypothetical protein